MGIFWSTPAFDVTKDIPDLTGLVALVSGANAGIGYQTALFLALNGAKVYVGSRSEQNALDAIREMEDAHPTLRGEGRLVYFKLDLSTIVGAKKDAEKFLELNEKLDILVNNAGIGNSTYELGPEGIERAFVVNHLAPFVLTETLLPILIKTAGIPGSDVRVVTVSSAAHGMISEIPTFDSLENFNSMCVKNPADANTFFNRTKRYGMSKLANILFAKELQNRLSSSDNSDATKIISIPLHPGLVSTRGPIKLFPFVTWYSIPPPQGAAASLFAATSPIVREKAEEYRGTYLESFGKIGTPSKLALDVNLAKTLWKTSEEVVADVLAKAST